MPRRCCDLFRPNRDLRDGQAGGTRLLTMVLAFLKSLAMTFFACVVALQGTHCRRTRIDYDRIKKVQVPVLT
jgi:hypothetical protein